MTWKYLSFVITSCLLPFTFFDEAGNIAKKLYLWNLDILLISHRSSVPSLLHCTFSRECIVGLSCAGRIKIQWRSSNRVSRAVALSLSFSFSPIRELILEVYVLIESFAKRTKAWADTWGIKSTSNEMKQLFYNLEKRKCGLEEVQSARKCITWVIDLSSSFTRFV